MTANSSADGASAIELFPYASPATIGGLERSISTHEFAHGSVLARRGDAPKYVHVLIDGYVGTTVTSPQANDYIIAFFKPGDAFLLCAVMLDTPYPVSITALQDSRVAMVPAGLFRSCAETDLALAVGVAKAIAAQRMDLAVHIRDLKLQRPAVRLASFLLSLVPDGQTAANVELPCDRRILAGWLGLVPASASRAFRELEEIGITGRNRHIGIASAERLRAYTLSAPA